MTDAYNRKVPESKYTYSYCVTVKVYLLNLLGNVEIADVIAPFLQMLTGLLVRAGMSLDSADQSGVQLH